MNDIAVVHLRGKRGGFAIVDADMFETLNKYKWWSDSNGYARTSFGGRRDQKHPRMHQMVAGTPKGFKTDHRNGYKIDNRRSNLRVCTNSQNLMNQRPQTRSKHSRFKGVSYNFRRKKWAAYIDVNRKRTWIGCAYLSEIDAANAYNEVAIKHHGEFCRLNDT